MKQEIKIPQMGESITETTIGKLLKKTGEFVEENEEIVELETEKVNQVLYAPQSGVLTWNIQEGDTKKIGDVIGTVEPSQKPKEEKPKEEQKKEEHAPAIEKQPSKAMSIGRGERVMKEDFIQKLKAPLPEKVDLQRTEMLPKAHETRRRMSKMRQTIANRLVYALKESAMLTTFNEVDMTQIMHLRTKHQSSFVEKYHVKLGLMSFFVKAVVEGLKKFPDFNAYLEGDDIVSRHYYDISVAVGTEKGLVVPVLRGCDKLSFAEIEKRINELAQKARASQLSIEDMAGGSFTITNGGVYGSMLSTPLLNPPQVGILGMHKIMKRAVVIDDAIVIRPMMYLALSYDHRIVDGKEAVGFLMQIKEILEDPTQLIFGEVNGQV